MPEYDEDGNLIETEPEPEGMQGLRQAKKAAEAEQRRLADELAQANADRREYAAFKAGLDPDDKTTKFFLDHYDGEPTVEAMKAAAVDAGIISDGSEETAQAVQAQTQMARAMVGGEPLPAGQVQVGPPHARHAVPAEEAEMWQEYEKAVRGPFGAQAGMEVLQKYGREAGGVDVEPMPGAGAPVTRPGTW